MRSAGKLTEFCVVIGEVGQKPMAGDSGATLGEDGGLGGDMGARLILIKLSLQCGKSSRWRMCDAHDAFK